MQMRTSLCCSDWTGQVSAHWLKDHSKGAFIRVRSASRSIGSSFCGFSLKFSRHEGPLPAIAARLWVGIQAYGVLLWKVYSFLGFTIVTQQQLVTLGATPLPAQQHFFPDVSSVLECWAAHTSFPEATHITVNGSLLVNIESKLGVG